MILTKDKTIQLLNMFAGKSAAAIEVANVVLADEQFCTIPSSTGKHHYYEGGNLHHTYEVTNIALTNSYLIDMLRTLADDDRDIDKEVVFLSALLHDYGKIYAYEPNPEKPGEWRKTKDYTVSLHIQKSVEKAKELLTGKISQEKLDAIVHCIGAHHGKIEWGALWLPKSPEAWLIHLADMLSVFCVANQK